jgi:hypothetical protein
MSEKPTFADNLTSKAVEAGTIPMFRGTCGSGLGIGLLSITPAVPDNWELWVQWPCVALVALGIGRASLALVWK